MDALVSAWISATEKSEGNPGASADDWAIQKVIDLHYDGEHVEIWKIILAIVDATESKWVLECVGAGPLEDLLTHHAPEYIERVVREAKSSTKFKTALSAVWLDEDDTPLYKQVYEVCGIEPPFEEPAQG